MLLACLLPWGAYVTGIGVIAVEKKKCAWCILNNMATSIPIGRRHSPTLAWNVFEMCLSGMATFAQIVWRQHSLRFWGDIRLNLLEMCLKCVSLEWRHSPRLNHQMYLSRVATFAQSDPSNVIILNGDLRPDCFMNSVCLEWRPSPGLLHEQCLSWLATFA